MSSLCLFSYGELFSTNGRSSLSSKADIRSNMISGIAFVSLNRLISVISKKYDLSIKTICVMKLGSTLLSSYLQYQVLTEPNVDIHKVFFAAYAALYIYTLVQQINNAKLVGDGKIDKLEYLRRVETPCRLKIEDNPDKGNPGEHQHIMIWNTLGEYRENR